MLGFFCAFACLLPAGQLQIGSQVSRNGAVVGRYVDDQVPNQLQVIADDLADPQPGLLLAGSWYTMMPSLPAGVIDMAEYYPVDGPADPVLPVPRERAYILQAFSWGDSLADGEARGGCSPSDTPASCAAKYSAPTFTQMRREWCGALSHNPLIVAWYYATPGNLGTLLSIEASPCPRVVSGRRHRRRSR